MITLYNYRVNEENSIFNDIVEGAGNAVRMFLEQQNNTPEYDKMQSLISENLAKYLVSNSKFYAAKYEQEGAQVLKNPGLSKNKDVRTAFEAVVAEIMNVALPMVSSQTYGEAFMEIHQVGWGDTATFTVSSNDLYKVNEIAEGVQRSTLQPIYNNEVTVNCGTIEVATSMDWYAIAAGKFDWGQFGARAGRSFEGYIMLKAIAAMASATAAMGSAYTAAGVSTKQWANLAERVSAANNGASVYALGTLNALNQAIPSTVGLQYGLGEEVAKKGHLDKYLGVTLIPFDQVLVPGTVNSTATLAIPDNAIYMVATDEYKPVKVVFEGNSVTTEIDAGKTTDKTFVVNIQMKIGVAAIVGSKFGTITIGG